MTGFEITRCFGTLCSIQRSIKIQTYFKCGVPRIDIHFMLHPVESEDESSISVSKTRTTFHINLQLEIDKVPEKKKSHLCLQCRPPSLFQTPPFPNSPVPGVCQSFQDSWNRTKRPKSWRWFQVGFIDWMRLWLSYL
jgi:hypothetical protein